MAPSPRPGALAFPFLALILFAASPVRAMDDDQVMSWRTGWRAPDKLQHVSLAFTGGLAIGVVAQEPAAAAGGALLLGVAKELWDRRRTRFDPGDLAADAVGAGLAAIATHAVAP